MRVYICVYIYVYIHEETDVSAPVWRLYRYHYFTSNANNSDRTKPPTGVQKYCSEFFMSSPTPSKYSKERNLRFDSLPEK